MMFTGIVEKTGLVEDRFLDSGGGAGEIVVSVGGWRTEDFAIGESIAVNGVCLTLARTEKKRDSILIGFDILKETFERSNLGRIALKSKVNLERALRVDGRFGGHFVSGHIDAACPVLNWKKLGRDWSLTVACAEEVSSLIVLKGSVAVDGVSLTITQVTERTFSVNLIPSTVETTALREREAGYLLNIETDIIGKYVNKLLAARQKKTISMDLLKSAGYE
jgi:riboflavin synthase